MEQILTEIPWTELSPWVLILLYILITKWDSISGAISSIWGRRAKREDQTLALLQEMIDWARDDFSDLEKKIDMMHIAVNQMRDMLSLHNQMVAHLIDKLKKPVGRGEGDNPTPRPERKRWYKRLLRL